MRSDDSEVMKCKLVVRKCRCAFRLLHSHRCLCAVAIQYADFIVRIEALCLLSMEANEKTHLLAG